MKVNKSEVINTIFALISVIISSYSVALMPHGTKRSVYEIIIFIPIYVTLYLIYKGVQYIVKAMRK